MYYADLNIPSRPGSNGTTSNPFGALEFLNLIENTGNYADEYGLWGTLPMTRSLHFRYYTYIRGWVTGHPWRVVANAVDSWDLDLKGNPNDMCWVDGLIFFSQGYVQQSDCNAMWACHLDCAGVAWSYFSKPAIPYNPDPNMDGKTVRIIKTSGRFLNSYWDNPTLAERHFHWIQVSTFYLLNWQTDAFVNCDVEFDGGANNRPRSDWEDSSDSFDDFDVTYNVDFSGVEWPEASSPDSAFDGLFGGHGFELIQLTGDDGLFLYGQGIPSGEAFGTPQFVTSLTTLLELIPQKKYRAWEYIQMLKSLFPRGHAWDWEYPYEAVNHQEGTIQEGTTKVMQIPGADVRDINSAIHVGSYTYILVDTEIRLYRWDGVSPEPVLVSDSWATEDHGILLNIGSDIYAVGKENGNLLKWSGSNFWVNSVYSVNHSFIAAIVFGGNIFACGVNQNLYRANLSGGSWVSVAPSSGGDVEVNCLFEYNGSLYCGTTAGVILRWNGSNAWVAGFDTGNDDFSVRSALQFSVNHYLYAAGSNGEMMEWNGSFWRVAAPGIAPDSEAIYLFEYNGFIYAINTRFDTVQILRWNGQDAWVVITSSGDRAYMGMFTINPLYTYGYRNVYLLSSMSPGYDTTTWAGSVMGRLMSCFASELERFEDDVMKLLRESVPGLANELLSDWERMAGLPDECSPLAGTIPQRQQIVHAKITQSKGNSSADEFIASNATYFIGYAESLGMTVVISEDAQGTPFRTTHKRESIIQRVTRMPSPEGIEGARLSSQGSLHFWTVTVINDPFGNRNTMECVFNKIKPAQTFVTFLP
jgi:uncharacterized protein YmfQ (DUF2313 family)